MNESKTAAPERLPVQNNLFFRLPFSQAKKMLTKRKEDFLAHSQKIRQFSVNDFLRGSERAESKKGCDEKKRGFFSLEGKKSDIRQRVKRGWECPAAGIFLFMEPEKLVGLVKELKKERDAVILVHNYQNPEMYEIADFIGDSLELSRKAAETDAKVILFCGVKFMAETAKILSPNKTVLLPSIEAGCSLADMAAVPKLKEMKEQHPDAAVVSYVNTYAEIKAMSDICCTSANAVKVVNSLPNKKIIFLPDKNLGMYVQKHTDKEIILWDGYCFVHEKLDAGMLRQIKEDNPGSEIIAHPEANQGILEMADHVCGTGGMAKYASSSSSNKFIVVTECGMTDRLRIDVPNKNFFSFCNLCHYMKSSSLELAARSLITNQHIIELDDKIIIRAKNSLQKMFEVS